MESGHRLGPYEIVSILGSGGMGEVYRARDPRLKRDVAIKILHNEALLDPQRKQRFQREAQTTSALNHPNILVVYDIGIENGKNFIVSELVEGQTLREIIQKKGLSLKRLLDIAIEIANGLAAAHGAGIVHRDLKPENVMITKDGYTKILDFGLAKLLNFEAVHQEAQTISRSLTESGVIQGTTPYMSPEQAADNPNLDFRSDQFSFGVLFYEMLTGKRAFQKQTAIETLNAIMKEDPEPIDSNIPAPIRWVIDRCLQKNPSDRYASTQDLAKELKDIRQHFSEFTSLVEPARSVISSRSKLSKIWNFLSVGLILGLGALSYSLLTKEEKLTSLPEFQRFTYKRELIESARFAPDGQTVVYSSMFQGKPLELYLARTNGFESKPLGIQNADVLSISKNNIMLLLLHRDKEILAQAPLTGGSPRELAEDVSDADWSPDGKQIALTTTGSGNSQVEFPMGNVIFKSTRRTNLVRISPKGNAIAFRECLRGDNCVIRIIDLKGKTISVSKEMWPQGLAWSKTGEKVFYTSGPSEAGRGSYLYTLDLSGSQQLVARFAGWPRIRDLNSNGQMILDFSDGGDVTVVKSEGDPSERDLSILDGTGISDFSSDAKRILVVERGEGSEGLLGTTYMRNVDGSPAVRLSDGWGIEFSEDGKWVLAQFDSTTVILVPTGPGNPKYFKEPAMSSYSPVGFVPATSKFLTAGTYKNKPTKLFLQDITGGKPIELAAEVKSTGFFLYAAISPDGRFVALEAPNSRISLFPLENGEQQTLSGIEPGEQPIHWTKDGSSILVFNPSKLPARIYKINVSSHKREFYKEIMPSDSAGLGAIWLVEFSDNQKSYAYTYARYLSMLYVVEGFD